ncbi:hypothetical protein N431DRAFT_187603 [Stipitochalara longipes BDJ]|nr:hypothetical protein N431DRAFT_187603 [Stipitochalara longipes BDJ]
MVEVGLAEENDRSRGGRRAPGNGALLRPRRYSTFFALASTLLFAGMPRHAGRRLQTSLPLDGWIKVSRTGGEQALGLPRCRVGRILGRLAWEIDLGNSLDW